MTDPIVTMQTPNLYGPAQSFGLTNRYDYKGMDPELALAERAADQRQLIANAILNQSSVPRRGKMVGRMYQKAHWAEGLGQLGEAAAGALMINNIQNKRAEAERDSTQRVTDAITKFNSATQDEPAGTITHAAQPAQPGNFEAVMSQQPSPSEVTPLRSVDDFSRQAPAPALTGQYQRATPNALYEMGSPAQPERTEVSPGLPVDERSRQAAMAQLAMSPHPQVKEFYQNQLALAKEARTQQQMDARDAEHTRQFGVTSGISQQMQDLAQRKERNDQARYAREDYDKNRQNEAALFEKSVEARAKIESDAATRLSNEAIARGHDATSKWNAASQREKPPSGMEIDPRGGFRTIKGSAPFMKEAKFAAADRASLESTQNSYLDMDALVTDMLSDKNKRAFDANFGTFSWATQPVATIGDNGRASNIKKDLDSVLAKVSAQGLAALRQEGGSPGSITENEWKILQGMMTSLSSTSSPEEARKLLGQIRTMMRRSAESKERNYHDLHTDERLPGVQTLEERKQMNKDSDARAKSRISDALPSGFNPGDPIQIIRGPEGKLVVR